jgi:ribosome biogenesis GTPase
MTHATRTASPSYLALGWSPFFEDQVAPEEEALAAMRIATVHRTRATAISPDGRVKLQLPVGLKTTDLAVGDWVLVQPQDALLVRRLERTSLLRRRTEGSHIPQLISANVDTLLIVTSCNEDFSPTRLERYLALANDAGIHPLIVLTKADKVEDAERYRLEAAALQRDLEVVTLNATEPEAAAVLAPWCGEGQTIALVGSSGVGKSTLLNTLAGLTDDEQQLTGSIREADAKGRHTTTSRSLHKVEGGGWVIDTPGMRSLHMSDAASGLATLFAEISELAPHCRFNNCTHQHEPGCAVLAAVASGKLDAERLERWRKLDAENTANTQRKTGPRGNKSAEYRPKKR